MQFKRYGKAYQLRIETPEDLDEILNLDEALWAATSAPLSLEEIRRCLANLDKQPFNGDGVIVAKSASDQNVATLIADAVAVTGGTVDAGGEPGITLAQLAAFGAASNAWLDWNEQGAGALAAGRESAVMPFGAETPALYAAFLAQREKVDDYFELCRMRRYDPNLTPSDRRGPQAGEGGRVGVAELRHWLATEPLARLSPDDMLPLCGPETNPFHAEGLAALRQIVLSRCLDKIGETLSEDDWRRSARPSPIYPIR